MGLSLQDPLFNSWDLSGWGLPVMSLAPSYTSLNKYAKKQPVVDHAKWAIACSFLARHHIACSTQEWSFDECVSQVDPNSSPGYGLSKEFGINRNVFLNQDITNALHEAFDADEYLTPGAIWSNSLKEEIRPLEKILKDKIRTFTAAPLTFTLLCSKYCGAFNEIFYSLGGKISSCVGTDLYYRGWHSLFLKLSKHPHAFELDESEYDSSLFRLILYSIAEFRFQQSDRSEKVRNALFKIYDSIVNTLIITADGNLVQKGTGNPSGSFNTIADNTLGLYLLLSYAWVCLVNDDYEQFNSNVELLLTGDDNTFTVSDVFVGAFNATNISNLWSTIGVTTTSPCYSPQPPSNVSFLSRHFSHEWEGIKVPVLCREKLVKSLIFSEYPNDPVMALTRIGGIRNVAFFDFELMAFLDCLVESIKDIYDPLEGHVLSYQNALKGILTHRELFNLYLGQREELSKDSMPPKNFIMNNQGFRKPAASGQNTSVVVAAKPRRPKANKAKAKGAAKKVNKAANRLVRIEKQIARDIGQTNSFAVGGMSKQLEGSIRGVRSSKLTKLCQDTILGLTLPENRNLRISSGLSGEPTGAFSVHDVEPVAFNNVSGTYTGDDNSFLIIQRSALRSSIRSVGINNLATKGVVIYSGGFQQLSIGSDPTDISPPALTPGACPELADPTGLNGLNVNTSGTILEAHGPYLFSCRTGRGDPRRGFWADNGSIAYVVMKPAPAHTYEVTVFELDGEDWRAFGAVVLPATGIAAFAINMVNKIGSYFSFRVRDTTIITNPGSTCEVGILIASLPTGFVLTPAFTWVSTSVNITGACSTIAAHQSLPDLDSQFTNLSNVKVLGASAMFTNTSQLLTRQGQVAGVQIPSDTNWVDFTQFEDVAQMKRAVTKDSKEGMYGYLLPQDLNELAQFLDEFEVGEAEFNGTGPEGMMSGSFLEPSPYPGVAIVTDMSSDVSRTGLFRVAFNGEFETNNQWREVREPRARLDQIAPALYALAKIPQFHTNDFHISDVWDWIKGAATSVVDGVLEYGPMVLKGAAMAAPFLL